MSIELPAEIRLRPTVTPVNVAMGLAGSCRCCPVALAIIDAMTSEYPVEGTDWVVTVGRDDACVWSESPFAHHGHLPAHVVSFIHTFDTHGVAERVPFTFDLVLRRQR
jgi:hypothetical protein